VGFTIHDLAEFTREKIGPTFDAKKASIRICVTLSGEYEYDAYDPDASIMISYSGETVNSAFEKQLKKYAKDNEKYQIKLIAYEEELAKYKHNLKRYEVESAQRKLRQLDKERIALTRKLNRVQKQLDGELLNDPGPVHNET